MEVETTLVETIVRLGLDIEITIGEVITIVEVVAIEIGLGIVIETEIEIEIAIDQKTDQEIRTDRGLDQETISIKGGLSFFCNFKLIISKIINEKI
jgi:hypothetical protein